MKVKTGKELLSVLLKIEEKLAFCSHDTTAS